MQSGTCRKAIRLSLQHTALLRLDHAAHSTSHLEGTSGAWAGLPQGSEPPGRGQHGEALSVREHRRQGHCRAHRDQLWVGPGNQGSRLASMALSTVR